MAWTKEAMEKAYQQVVKKAVTDEAYRKELLADPGKAIEKVSGEKVPADVKIKIVEQDPAYQATFVLPPMVKEDISDAELDAVAGGCGIDFGACGAKACGAEAGASLK